MGCAAAVPACSFICKHLEPVATARTETFHLWGGGDDKNGGKCPVVPSPKNMEPDDSIKLNTSAMSKALDINVLPPEALDQKYCGITTMQAIVERVEFLPAEL